MFVILDGIPLVEIARDGQIPADADDDNVPEEGVVNNPVLETDTAEDEIKEVEGATGGGTEAKQAVILGNMNELDEVPLDDETEDEAHHAQPLRKGEKSESIQSFHPFPTEAQSDANREVPDFTKSAFCPLKGDKDYAQLIMGKRNRSLHTEENCNYQSGQASGGNITKMKAAVDPCFIPNQVDLPPIENPKDYGGARPKEPKVPTRVQDSLQDYGGARPKEPKVPTQVQDSLPESQKLSRVGQTKSPGVGMFFRKTIQETPAQNLSHTVGLPMTEEDTTEKFHLGDPYNVHPYLRQHLRNMYQPPEEGAISNSNSINHHEDVNCTYGGINHAPPRRANDPQPSGNNASFPDDVNARYRDNHQT